MIFINLALVGVLIYLTREYEIIFFIVSPISFLFALFILLTDFLSRPKDYDKLSKISELKLEQSGLNRFDANYKTKKDNYDLQIAEATSEWGQVPPGIRNILNGHPEKRKVYEKYHLYFKSPFSSTWYSTIFTFFSIYFFVLIIFFLFDWIVYKAVISFFMFLLSIKYASILNPLAFSTSKDSKTLQRKQYIMDIQGDLEYARNDDKKVSQINKEKISNTKPEIENAEIYLKRGDKEFGLGNNKEAIKNYTKAIELSPTNAVAYFNRGNVKYVMADIGAALEDYSKSITLNPNYTEAYTNRGYAKARMSDHNAAMTDYNKAIEINPNYADAYVRRGFSKNLLGDKEDGIQDLKKAADLGYAQANELIEKYFK